jgi:hypothetical protein
MEERPWVRAKDFRFLNLVAGITPDNHPHNRHNRYPSANRRGSLHTTTRTTRHHPLSAATSPHFSFTHESRGIRRLAE